MSDLDRHGTDGQRGRETPALDDRDRGVAELLRVPNPDRSGDPRRRALTPPPPPGERAHWLHQAFDGVRVVEVAQWVFVPVAGALLADWGAEVVHIEPIEG